MHSELGVNMSQRTSYQLGPGNFHETSPQAQTPGKQWGLSVALCLAIHLAELSHQFTREQRTQVQGLGCAELTVRHLT